MENKKPIIIPVASGKGGVGKTIISVNLAFALAELGKKTILIDLDFGGANIHTCLGYDSAPDGIGNFLNTRRSQLTNYLLGTDNKNLSFIPGDAEMVGIANITNSQKKKLITQLLQLDADYIILDLGAGSSYNTIDFFMISSFGILVAMPELISILNAYAFLKNAIFRILYLNMKKYHDVHQIFKEKSLQGGESAWKLSDLLDKIFEIDPDIHAEAMDLLEHFNPKIIINMARKPKDVAMGEKLRKISSTYLGIDMEYLGFLYRDTLVSKSLSKRKPLASYNPQSQIYQTMVRMAYKITNAVNLPHFILDINSYDDSLEMVLEEATDDLVSRIEGYEELADENLLTVNELISLVKNLEYENIQLKKKISDLENKALKYKNH